MMSDKVHTKAELETIEADQRNSHAVFFVDCVTDDELEVESEIQEGLNYLRDRASNAGMEILSSQVSQSVYYEPVRISGANGKEEIGGCGHICISIICAWISRENLERMRLQQTLAGSPPSGPRRA